MNTWTEEGMFVTYRKGSGSLRQCKIYPNKDHLGSKDSLLGSPTVDIVQRLSFTKFSRQAKGNSTIENEYYSEAFVVAKKIRRMLESTPNEVLFGLNVDRAKRCIEWKGCPVGRTTNIEAIRSSPTSSTG